MSVSTEIHAELARQGSNMRALSEATGIKYTTMRNSMAGRRDFTSTELEEIADALNVPAWLLMKRATENEVAA